MFKIHTILTLIIISYPTQSFAYIDPGTGSVILQMLLGFVAAIIATSKLYWYKIKGFFSKKKNKINFKKDHINSSQDNHNS